MGIAESECRRPTFTPGVPIVLADGQAWHFPRPSFELFPEVGPDGRVSGIGRASTFGPEYEDLLEAFYRDDSDRLRGMFALAVDLLGRNYDLAPADFRCLLRFRRGDPDREATWRQILDVAEGNGPKAWPVGGEPT